MPGMGLRPDPGSRHDNHCLGESGVLLSADPRSWLGDKGYIGNNMLTPFRKPEGGELPDRQKEFNKQINKIRYIIEQVIANFKTWRIMHTDYRFDRAAERIGATTSAAAYRSESVRNGTFWWSGPGRQRLWSSSRTSRALRARHRTLPGSRFCSGRSRAAIEAGPLRQAAFTCPAHAVKPDPRIHAVVPPGAGRPVGGGHSGDRCHGLCRGSRCRASVRRRVYRA
jgi:hypothetical protein